MMPLRPQTIGRDMSHGFSGSYARQPDMIEIGRASCRERVCQYV